MLRMDPREIQQLEERCVQIHAPACNAACPMHIDVRALIGAIADKNFDKALRIFSQKIPFPSIIGRICDHPCQSFCKRQEVGNALSISSLERASLEYGSLTTKSQRSVPQKKERIAIIGGGLSGLTAALLLRKKGYRITLFETSTVLGGQIWNFSEDILPRSVIHEEIERITKTGVSIQLNSIITINDLYNDFDAFYYATGHTATPDPMLLRNKTNALFIDPVTYCTKIDGVFAGGSSRFPSSSYSPISSVADGHRAAISIERYLKKVSLTAGRELEKPYITKLYTNTEKAESLPAIPMRTLQNRYTPEEAIEEANRCFQCQCLECMKTCGYLMYFDQYPGKCLRSISKNLIIQTGYGMRLATKFINACRLCGLCKEMCPNDLDLGFINLEARRIMVDKGYMPEAIHYFPIRDMVFSNSKKCTLSRHEPGKETSRFLFFPGCQLSASRPDHVEKIYAYLREKIHEGVGIMLRCCGAPAEWAGRQNTFLQEIQYFSTRWKELGKPVVITACPTCHRMIKENLPNVPLEALWKTLTRIGLPSNAKKGNGKILAVHDSCSSRHEKVTQNSVRQLITQLGYAIEELPLNREKTECCGYGGLMYHINQGVTKLVIKNRISLSTADYVSYCSNCRDFFATQGKPSLHILDLIFSTNIQEEALRGGPGYSTRHENRIRLKNRLLRKLWGETEAMKEGFETVTVLIDPQIQKKMEEQCILVEDIQQIIFHAEKTGDKAFNPKNGHFVAHLRPEIITYWVEYTVEPEGYRIYNAYSHRLQIIEDETQS